MIALVATVMFSAPSFDIIEGDGLQATHAAAVSGDGQVVVGQATTAGETPTTIGYRWAVGAVLERIEDMPGGLDFCDAVAVDEHGDVIVGVAYRGLQGDEQPANPEDTSGIEMAFKWTPSGGMDDIGELPGGMVRALANDVSADGKVIVGASYDQRDDFVGCYWDGGAAVSVGAFESQSPRSDARAVSADGTVIVGGSPKDEPNGSTGTRSFAWTADGGLVELGDLAGGGTYSSVADVSGDGRIAVGAATSLNASEGELEAWRAVIGEKPEALGDLPGGIDASEALAVDDEGTVIVGRSTTTDNYDEEAFVWTRPGGMERLADVAARAGVTIPDGWLMAQATDVSRDGLVFVGNAVHTDGRVRAFRLEVSAESLPKTEEPDGPVIIDTPGDGKVEGGCAGGVAAWWMITAVMLARRRRA